jgi:hypothetical protein
MLQKAKKASGRIESKLSAFNSLIFNAVRDYLWY